MRAFAIAFVVLLATPAFSQPKTAARSADPYAAQFAAFAAADREHMPPACAFLFVGSSSIRLWKTLEADMAPLPVINRGFGGSTIAEADAFFDRLVAPYRPRAIVFYSGENDLAGGKTPAQVTADFERFMALKTRALGATPVYFISLKPSKLRVDQMAQQTQTNAAVRKLAAGRQDLRYIDVVPAMLDGGKPKDIFVADGLHMTPQGYALWTAAVRPVLEQEAKAPSHCKAG